MTASTRLEQIFENTRTICFGRFLIEIPFTATVVYGPAEVELPIEYYAGQSKRLSEYLASRLTEVEQEREFLDKDATLRLPLFGKVIDGALPGQKISFGSKDQSGYTIHSLIPIGKDLFIQHIDSSLPKYDEVPVLNRIATHLRPRSENEIPADAGMCIDGAFVPLEQDYERVTIGIRLKEFPDVHISVDAHKNLKRLRTDNSPKLLREQAEEFAKADGLGAVFARTKILRQHERQLNIWDGEELALRTPAYKDDKSVHDFRFHSVGAINDRLHPELDIRLDSGLKGNDKARVEPSLSDEEALALWDKIINTVRIRQPSDATSLKPATPKVPLASTVRTGETCPETGWWECSASQRIEGSKRRLFKAGETMPLVLLKDPGLWQRLTGQHAVRQIATMWQLVQYNDETPLSIAG